MTEVYIDLIVVCMPSSVHFLNKFVIKSASLKPFSSRLRSSQTAARKFPLSHKGFNSDPVPEDLTRSGGVNSAASLLYTVEGYRQVNSTAYYDVSYTKAGVHTDAESAPEPVEAHRAKGARQGSQIVYHLKHDMC